jgi:glucans biosynthesis protein
VIDFEGPGLDTPDDENAIEPVVTAASGGSIVRAYVLPVVGTDAWRLSFDLQLDPGVETVDLRAFLSRDGIALTETWLGQIHPGQW